MGNLGRTWPRGRLAWAPERIEGCEFSVISGVCTYFQTGRESDVVIVFCSRIWMSG